MFAVFDIYRTRFGALLTAAADRRHALRVSDEVIRRWRSFSQTGTPRDWPAYTHTRRAVMVIDRKSRVEIDPHRTAGWRGTASRWRGERHERRGDRTRHHRRTRRLTASWLTEKIGAGTSRIHRRADRHRPDDECYSVQLTYAVPGGRRRWCSRSRPPIR
ncbi:carboxylesterase domain protein [Mycobacterium ulcerans str. Harvey]|uniref:Carboxylesterase domain protein n=1 Tax=Mycobacterium ulcerans str. Harvey TaxID=1299332 RepID=A0ABN0QYZ6_MYCUL|nr:carboxylesterase domain protein [Mycobacterium ulcerans str. Harvey]